jgi:WS/DGAT/MGAT family acyltransferase
MRRMTSQDAAFLYSETPTWHMHVAALALVDPATSDGVFSFDLVRRLTLERLPAMPQFRWRLVDVPFGVDRPGWVEADEIDAEFHFRRATVPPPGDEESFDHLVADIVSAKLDRARPLWEIHVVDGRADGLVGVITKVHHALIDGISGAGLTEVLLDWSATPRPAPDAERDPIGHDAPSAVSLFTEGLVRSAATAPFRLARFGVQSVRQAASAIGRFGSGPRPTLPYTAPRTPLNGEFTARRRLGRATLPMAQVLEAKRALGRRLGDVKMNDVVLGLVTGSLREYLVELDALPDAPLVAQCPVSLRTEADRDHVGSKVGSMFASLPTHLEDPIDRMAAIVESTRAGKDLFRAVAEHKEMGITEAITPGMLGLAARLFTSLHLERMPASVNVVVSNVPGPPIPLYLAGAEVLGLYPMGPLLLGMGLNITAFSHADQIDIGCFACPDLVERPERIAQGMREALDELSAALG